jgi:outer membrane protein assembly factor BamB
MGTIAVVPIFVNVGAAVLPTIVAAVTSVVVLVLRPRDLLRLVLRRPVAAGVSVGAIAVVLATVIGYRAHAKPGLGARSDRAGQVQHYDWAKVAEDLIAQQRVRQAPTVLATNFAGSPAPAQAGQDFSRSFYAGGPSPVGLNHLWSFRPEDTLFFGGSAVAGDRVFVAGCQTDLGGYTGLLACLDRQTGKPLWQITESKGEPLRPFFSSPAVTEDGKYLVIGQGLHADRDCSLLGFEAATGRLHWAVKTPLHIESSPAIAGDMAVVGVGAVEGRDGRPVGDPGYCLAVRISDGKELWRQPVNDAESSPAIDDDGIVYIGSGFNGCAVVALRSDPDEQLAAEGLARVVWRTPVPQPITGPITLTGDVVIAGGGNGDMVHSKQDAQGLVIALDRKTGTILWQTRLDDAVLGGVACRDGTLICPVRTGEVVALALKDGGILWRTRISGNAPVLGGCAFTGHRVYAVSNDGYLAVLDPKDGQVLEKTYLNDQARPGTGLTIASVRIVEGRVIVGSETGGLRCLVGSGGVE